MALTKQPFSLNFMKGMDTKTDPFQIPMDSFTLLTNSVFTTLGRLTKRNGFQSITSLPNALQTNLTTLNDNLIATGTDLYAFNADANQWLNKGIVQPVQLSTNTITRTSTSQSSSDAAVASNNLVCTVYNDSNGSAYYQISDSVTGQQIIPRVKLEATAVNPRAFVLGNYFIVVYMATVGTPSLRYVAIPLVNVQAPRAAATFSSSVSAITDGYDGIVINNSLFISWSSSSSSIRTGFITSALIVSSSVSNTTSGVTSLVSLANDLTNSRLYVTYYSNGTIDSISYNYALAQQMTTTTDVTAANIATLTSVFLSGILYVFYETTNLVTQLNNTDQNFVSGVQVTPPVGSGAGTPGAPYVILRSLGLASKAFIQYQYIVNNEPNIVVTSNVLPGLSANQYTVISSTIYMLTVYGEPAMPAPPSVPTTPPTSNEPTYFLIDSTGQIYMRLAFANGGGYETTQVLSNVSFLNGAWYVSYLYKDLLTTVNKGTATGLPSAAIYTQTGVNLATFSINATQQYSSEIAGSLHLTGGMLWQYDGVAPIEHNFHVWPEDQAGAWSSTGGNIHAQPDGATNTNAYWYEFTYEWTDATGNLHRSAPSIPVPITTTGSGTTGSITFHVPTLRLTSKQPNPIEVAAGAPVTNPIRIVGYRWSVAQQVYYQFTSIQNPVLNDPTMDYVTIVDTSADASILGNAILYTTGGVVEDIAAPASVASTLFNNRLWLVDAEDRNLLWYSKQVIEAVPVEMSDLLTIYVAPTSGAQGSTGEITALAPMDDKLVIFKRDAIYYINGIGPDNTGANSQYSDPIFITSAVGCNNPNSIVLMQNGLMFQSDKGIWLLGRDLSTNYIGAPVEAYNNLTVMSAQSIPATNQVRFIMNENITLMYDYYVNQWGKHTNISAISGTLYQNFQTYLNEFGSVFQETPGVFVDGAEPVLMSLTTAWINMAGLQGYERFYFGYLLGTYFTPFTLDVQLAYDYNPSPIQNITVRPDNYSLPWGGEAQWGSGASWGSGTSPSSGSGGTANVFEARFFPQFQKCESFQVTINEVYDPTIGAAAGQGLSLSGLNLIVGMKKGYRTQRASRSFGRN